MPGDEDPKVALRQEADDLLSRLRRLPDDATLEDGRSLVERLRKQREFGALTKVAEAVARQAPKDATTRRRYAQALIETGQATVAIDVLRPLVKDKKESAEAYGLIGRANKQIFFDAGDKAGPAAREALKQAIAAYRVPFEAAPTKNYWHGVNLVAVLTAARRIGLRVAPELHPTALAKSVIAALGKTPQTQRDLWYRASVAEANLAVGNWGEVEENLRAYVDDPKVGPFELGSTLRQFTEVWNLEADERRGRPLVAILRAKAMTLPGAAMELSPGAVRQLATVKPGAGQLEAVLGPSGPLTYKWMQNGMKRAQSVGAVRKKSDGRRHGTCFLVKASLLGLPNDELVALTNHHVVNPDGVGLGIRPGGVEVQFEAIENSPVLAVNSVIWNSPPESLDAAILRLAEPPVGVTPLDATPHLPVLDESQRVYLIGYPYGDELAFSFQDNELIDHEGPPRGTPPVAGRVRLHYRAPTEGGSSGSPVFNADWEVIGLHHLGGKLGVEKLNGKAGTYAANEGIWIQSLAKAAKL
jgi:hypothetical protein